MSASKVSDVPARYTADLPVPLNSPPVILNFPAVADTASFVPSNDPPDMESLPVINSMAALVVPRLFTLPAFPESSTVRSALVPLTFNKASLSTVPLIVYPFRSSLFFTVVVIAPDSFTSLNNVIVSFELCVAGRAVENL